MEYFCPPRWDNYRAPCARPRFQIQRVKLLYSVTIRFGVAQPKQDEAGGGCGRGGYKRDVVRRDAIRTPAALGPTPRSCALRSLGSDWKGRGRLIQPRGRGRERKKFSSLFTCHSSCRFRFFLTGERCSPSRFQRQSSWSSSPARFTLRKQRLATITTSNR